MATQSHKMTTLSYALIGLIKMQPNTGYGLRKIFQETPMGRYSSSPGAIYPALRVLESAALIRGTSEVGKTGRETQLFRCTALGTRKLNAWLRQPVTVEQVQRDLEITLLRFSYLDLLDDLDWSIEFLRQFTDAVENCLVETTRLKATMQPHAPKHGLLALGNGIEVLSAHANWAKATIAELGRYRTLQ